MIRARTVSAPTRVALKVSVPVVFSVPPSDKVVGTLADRQALAGDHALVDTGCPVDDDAVDRDRFAWSNAQEVADPHLADLDVSLRAVAEDPSGSRREADQAADRIRGMQSGAGLEEAAEEDQRDDRGSGVEVERWTGLPPPKAGGLEEVREDDRRDRVRIGRRRTDRDERVHVLDRCRSAFQAPR